MCRHGSRWSTSHPCTSDSGKSFWHFASVVGADRGEPGAVVAISSASVSRPTTALPPAPSPEPAQRGPEAVLSSFAPLCPSGQHWTATSCWRRGSGVWSEGKGGAVQVSLEMVRLGMAYAYRQYLSGCDENAYLGAEAQAERGRQGVWRWGNEVKPWEFRKSR